MSDEHGPPKPVPVDHWELVRTAWNVRELVLGTRRAWPGMDALSAIALSALVMDIKSGHWRSAADLWRTRNMYWRDILHVTDGDMSPLDKAAPRERAAHLAIVGMIRGLQG